MIDPNVETPQDKDEAAPPAWPTEHETADTFDKLQAETEAGYAALQAQIADRYAALRADMDAKWRALSRRLGGARS